MIMKKFFLALIVIISYNGNTYALNNTFPTDSIGKVPQTKPSKTVWISAGQLLFHQEIQLGFEKEFSPGMCLEGTLGYKYATHKDQVYNVLTGGMGHLQTY
jgi:hypothetical protein